MVIAGCSAAATAAQAVVPPGVCCRIPPQTLRYARAAACAGQSRGDVRFSRYSRSHTFQSSRTMNRAHMSSRAQCLLVPGTLPAAQPVDDVDTVDVGQAEVEHDQVGMEVGGGAQCRGAVGGDGTPSRSGSAGVGGAARGSIVLAIGPAWAAFSPSSKAPGWH
jgi:hypothetical protein